MSKGFQVNPYTKQQPYYTNSNVWKEYRRLLSRFANKNQRARSWSFKMAFQKFGDINKDKVWY